MKRLILCGLILFMSLFIYAKNAATLIGLEKPFFLEVDGDRMFITDGPIIYIYSLTDFTLLKKFGKEGEGPGEFKISPLTNNFSVHICLQPGQILVNSMGRISYFTRDGKYLKEIQTGAQLGVYQPLGNDFVGAGMAQEDKTNYITVNIYDASFKKKVELYRTEMVFQMGKDIDPFAITSIVPHVYDNKVFIKDKGDIHVFDSSGKKQYSITYQYDKIKVTKPDRENVHSWYKANPMTKDFYPIIKERLKFPDYFPDIRFYTVANQKVYVLTYKKSDGKSEFVIFDVKGKFLKKIMLPFGERDKFFFSPYIIKKDTLYQLIENDEIEEWELHITKI